jgi:hypothetical protein
MDIYGNPDDILSGGTVEGDLEVKGNLDIDGDVDVSGTLTTDVFISRESVETKDSLLHLGVDNVADTSNLGTFWEYDDGVKRYGGLVRDKGTKDVVLFKDESVKPTPGSDISAFTPANLKAFRVDCTSVLRSNSWFPLSGGNVTIGGAGSATSVTIQGGGGGVVDLRFRTGNATHSIFCVLNDDDFEIRLGRSTPNYIRSFSNPVGERIAISTNLHVDKQVVVGSGVPATQYELPSTRGTDTQILKTDGAGIVTWADSPFDQNLNRTDPVVFKTVSIGTTASDGTTFLGDDGFSFYSRWSNTVGGVGTSTRRYRGTQSVPLAILNNDVLYEFINLGYDGSGLIQGSSFRTFANQNWTVGNTGTCFEIDITRLNETGRHPYFRLDSGGVTLGDIDAGLEYKLPPTRGTDTQILKTNGAGVVTWADSPFDQNLDKNEAVQFLAVTATSFSASLNNVDGVNLIAQTPAGLGSESLKITHNLIAATTDIATFDKNKIVFDLPLESKAIACTDFIYSNSVGSANLELGTGFVFHNRSDNTPGGVGLSTKKSRGTLAVPSAVLLNDKLKSIIVHGHDGNDYVESGSMQYLCSENWSVGNTGTNLIFDITPKTTTGRVPWFTIADDYFEFGNRDAGTAYKLPSSRGQYEQILRTDQNGNVSWSSPGKFCKTDAFQTLSNSTVETSMIGNGPGNKTLAQVNAGDNYHFKISGTIQTESKLDEVAFRINVGTVEVFESTFINLAEVKVDNAFELEVDLTARTGGTTPQWYSSGVFVYSANNGAGEGDGRMWISETNVVSTELLFPVSIDFSAQWSVQALNNILIVKQVVMTKTF